MTILISTVLAAVLAVAALALHPRHQSGQHPAAPDVAAPDQTRIENYANGTRRILLVAETPAADAEWLWTARVALAEAAIEAALQEQGAPYKACDLRHHGGRTPQARLLCWDIPAPHGLGVLTAYDRHVAALDELNAAVHVIADR